MNELKKVDELWSGVFKLHKCDPSCISTNYDKINEVLHTKDDNGNTILLEAVQRNNKDIICRINQKDKTFINEGTITPLGCCVYCNKYDMAKYLLEIGADVNKNTRINFDFVVDEEYEQATPLIMATFYKNLEMMKLLLFYKADPNEKTTIGRITALHYAICSGFVEGAKLLIEKGANVHQFTTVYKDFEKVDSSKQQYDEANPLIIATFFKNLEIMKLLLYYNANSNAPTKYSKKTAMHYAAMVGFVQGAELLIDNGASLYIFDIDGRNLMHEAASTKFNNSVFIKFLKKNNLNPDLQDDLGKTPLHVAVRAVSKDNINALLEIGVRSIKTHEGEDPLNIAVSNFKEYDEEKTPEDEKDEEDVCEILIKSYLNNTIKPPLYSNKKEAFDADDFHELIKYGNLNYISKALKKGFGYDTRNSKGDLPLYSALESNDFSVIEFVLQSKDSLPCDIKDKEKILQKVLELNDQELINLIKTKIKDFDSPKEEIPSGKKSIAVSSIKKETPLISGNQKPYVHSKKPANSLGFTNTNAPVSKIIKKPYMMEQQTTQYNNVINPKSQMYQQNSPDQQNINPVSRLQFNEKKSILKSQASKNNIYGKILPGIKSKKEDEEERLEYY